jgi:hypothetical protein
MADLGLPTLDGAVKTIRAEDLQAFGAELRGLLIDANSVGPMSATSRR